MAARVTQQHQQVLGRPASKVRATQVKVQVLRSTKAPSKVTVCNVTT